MRVGVVQFEPEFGEVRRNLDRVLAMVAREEGDLFVLPELVLSGYLFESRAEALALAQSGDARELEVVSRAARERGATIVMGFAERSGDRLFNSALLAAPDGSRSVYRKIQLFCNEKRIFDPGDRPPGVIDVQGVRLGMMICFDWIFPEVTRSLAIRGADIVCHGANLVLPYCQDAMVTRCIENRVFALTANRIGTESRAGLTLTFTGRSQIVAPDGEVLGRASVDREELLMVEIDHTKAREKSITADNDVLADRRPDLYRLE